MEMWLKEMQLKDAAMTYRVKETLVRRQTEFQDLAIVDTESFGRMLVLDGIIQTTIKDEFVYHEMISMVALNSHPDPRKVLIIGGGDGGALREVLRHPRVEKGVLVEIDDRVIQAARDYFPALACSFDNPKAEVIVDDGIKYIQEHKNEFDVILIDSTEPVGPAIQLFSQEFYQSCFAALKEDGMMVAQSESPFINKDVIQMICRGIGKVFPLTNLYLANIPTYPSGLWSFTVGSKKHDPRVIQTVLDDKFKYYTPAVHKAAFELPAFVQEIVGQVK